ncbi:hypothetical protein AB6N23_11980, partial [Cellulomonas sp. 179-A 9B4 NHS]
MGPEDGPPSAADAGDGATTTAPPGAERQATLAAAAAGVAAGTVTVGVGALVAAVTGASSDPLVAVGSAFVDLTPAWLKDWAVTAFGTADKVALAVGQAVVLALLAALAGVLAWRRWSSGAVLVVALGGLAGVAATTRPDAGLLAPVPSVAGALAGLLVLRALLRRVPPPAAAVSAPAASAPPPRSM